MIRKVGEIPGLTVRPTSAIRKYLGSADPLRAAKELGVDAVLDGTGQTAGDRIRASLNLLETSSRTPLWSPAFDVRFGDLFELDAERAPQAGTEPRVHFDGAQPHGRVRRP